MSNQSDSLAENERRLKLAIELKNKKWQRLGDITAKQLRLTQKMDKVRKTNKQNKQI
jgi:hypothetical protein